MHCSYLPHFSVSLCIRHVFTDMLKVDYSCHMGLAVQHRPWHTSEGVFEIGTCHSTNPFALLQGNLRVRHSQRKVKSMSRLDGKKKRLQVEELQWEDKYESQGLTYVGSGCQVSQVSSCCYIITLF